MSVPQRCMLSPECRQFQGAEEPRMGSLGPRKWDAPENYRICEAHFKKSDFRGYGLQKDAVPSIFNPSKKFQDFVPAAKRPKLRDILIDHPYARHPESQPNPASVPRPPPTPKYKLMPAPEFLHARPVRIAPAPQVQPNVRPPQEHPGPGPAVRVLRPMPTTLGGYKLLPAPEFLCVPPAQIAPAPLVEPWKPVAPALVIVHDVDGVLSQPCQPGALEYAPQLPESSDRSPTMCSDTKTPPTPSGKPSGIRPIRPFRPWHLNRRQ